MQNNSITIYQTKIFYLWIIAMIVACVLIPVLKGYIPSVLEVMIDIVLIYLTGVFTMRQLVFKKDTIEIRNVLFPFNRGVVKIVNYKNLYSVEIRNIRGMYQLPYLILNYSARNEKSNNFILRSGIYNEKDNLDPLIEHIKKMGVTLKTKP